MAGTNILSQLSYLNMIAQLAGVGKWDLQQASYNGCSFMVMSGNALNPLSGVVAVLNGTGATAYIPGDFTKTLLGYGLDVSDPNRNLYATSMSIMKLNDTIKKKLVKFKIPNGADVIQEFGEHGSSIQMEAIFAGEQYLEGLNNFIQAALKQTESSRAYENVNTLIHPIYGNQQEVYLSGIDLSYSSDKNRAVTVLLNFECTRPVSIGSNLINSTGFSASNIAKYFQMVEQSIFSLNQTVAFGSLL